VHQVGFYNTDLSSCTVNRHKHCTYSCSAVRPRSFLMPFSLVFIMLILQTSCRE